MSGPPCWGCLLSDAWALQDAHARVQSLGVWGRTTKGLAHQLWPHRVRHNRSLLLQLGLHRGWLLLLLLLLRLLLGGAFRHRHHTLRHRHDRLLAGRHSRILRLLLRLVGGGQNGMGIAQHQRLRAAGHLLKQLPQTQGVTSRRGSRQHWAIRSMVSMT